MTINDFAKVVPLTPPLSDGGFPGCEDVEDVATLAKSVQFRHEATVFERKMGDTELSYFLPSRQSGVNDM